MEKEDYTKESAPASTSYCELRAPRKDGGPARDTGRPLKPPAPALPGRAPQARLRAGPYTDLTRQETCLTLIIHLDGTRPDHPRQKRRTEAAFGPRRKRTKPLMARRDAREAGEALSAYLKEAGGSLFSLRNSFRPRPGKKMTEADKSLLAGVYCRARRALLGKRKDVNGEDR